MNNVSGVHPGILDCSGTPQDSDPSLTQAVISRLLGNTSGSAEAAAANPVALSAAAALPNPVLKFLHAREEPKVVSMRAQQEPRHNVDVRKMHQAGGYDNSSYEQRNWAEINMHLAQARLLSGL
jgi:hypothetical protein